MNKKQIIDFTGETIGWQVDGELLGSNGRIFDTETLADRFMRDVVLRKVRT